MLSHGTNIDEENCFALTPNGKPTFMWFVLYWKDVIEYYLLYIIILKKSDCLLSTLYIKDTAKQLRFHNFMLSTIFKMHTSYFRRVDIEYYKGHI